MICHLGGRSAAATGSCSSGWTDVVNVAGGMDAWERGGLPVRRGAPDPARATPRLTLTEPPTARRRGSSAPARGDPLATTRATCSLWANAQPMSSRMMKFDGAAPAAFR